MAEIAGIVLGGGQSRRMGVDKATLVVDGSTMLERSVALLHQAGITNVAVMADGHFPDPPARDGQPRYQGPMAGIVAGWRNLRQASPQVVVVISCDLPALTSPVITSLIQQAATTVHGAVAFDGERRQPLIAAYRAAALEAADAAFDNGERSMRRLAEAWDLCTVSFARSVLADADTPEDLTDYSVEWPTDDSAGTA